MEEKTKRLTIQEKELKAVKKRINCTRRIEIYNNNTPIKEGKTYNKINRNKKLELENIGIQGRMIELIS